MSSNVPRRFSSDAEERVRLVESPEMEVPVATCFEESEEVAHVATEPWQVLARSEAPAATSPADGMQESADPARMEAHPATTVNESPEADPECKVPTASCKETSDPAAKLLQHLAEFTNMQLPDGPTFSVEFQMMLQLLECSAQQQKLLHQVHDRVEYMQSELEGRMDTFHCELSNIRCDNSIKPDANLSGAVGVSLQRGEGQVPFLEQGTGDEIGSQAIEVGQQTGVTGGQPDVFAQEEVKQERRPSITSVDSTSSAPQTTMQFGSTIWRQVSGGESTSLQRQVTEMSAVPEGSTNSMQFSELNAELEALQRVQANDGDENEEDEDSAEEKPLRSTSRFGLSSGVTQLTSILAEESRREVSETNVFRKCVSHHYFDAFCAAVIVTNAVTIGVQAQLDVQWALANREVPADIPKNGVIATMDKVYIAFYFCELILKLSIWRCSFFSGEDKKWNIFDLVLVIAGIYDLILELTPLQFGGDFGFTWLRIVRLLKMLKMLRVVRVMRFFKQLRLMVTSIAGSLATLFWSVIMMSMIMYTFGLCFLQAVSSHLTTENLHITEDGDWDDTREGIESYWSSVVQSMISLYFAVTGGADWEPLAAPIKTADPMFFVLFFVYIMFMSVAVLNVLTGMFVDQAMKFSEQDEENVIEELEKKPEVHAFRDFIKSEAKNQEGFTSEVEQLVHRQSVDASDHEDAPMLTWKMLNKNEAHTVILDFFRALEITEEDGKRVFRMLDPEKTEKCEAEEFIRGCLAAKGNIVGLNLVFLVSETKRLAQQLTISMVYVEERFDELYDTMTISASIAGTPVPGTPGSSRCSLRQKLNQAQVLPPHHMQHFDKKQQAHKQKIQEAAMQRQISPAEKKERRASLKIMTGRTARPSAKAAPRLGTQADEQDDNWHATVVGNLAAMQSSPGGPAKK